jgi:hypothetical protein
MAYFLHAPDHFLHELCKEEKQQINRWPTVEVSDQPSVEAYF